MTPTAVSVADLWSIALRQCRKAGISNYLSGHFPLRIIPSVFYRVISSLPQLVHSASPLSSSL